MRSIGRGRCAAALSGLGAALVLLGACREARPSAPVLALDGDVQRGEAQYQIVCAGCHGPTGHGIARAPALTTSHRMSDDTIVAVMLNGRGRMPAKRIDDQTAADVLAWMRATFPAPGGAPPGDQRRK